MKQIKSILSVVALICLTACGKTNSSNTEEIDNSTRNVVAIKSGLFGYSRNEVADTSSYYMVPERFTDEQYRDLAEKISQAYASVDPDPVVIASLTIKGFDGTADEFKKQDIIKESKSAIDKIITKKDNRIAFKLSDATVTVYPYNFETKSFKYRLGSGVTDHSLVYQYEGYGPIHLTVQGVSDEDFEYKPNNDEEARALNAIIAPNAGSGWAFAEGVVYGRVVKSYKNTSHANRPYIVVVPDRIDVVLKGKVLWSANGKLLDEVQRRNAKCRVNNVYDESVGKLLGLECD